MGSATAHICKACGTKFGVRDGGGFFFDMLHCDTCGKVQGVGHRDLGESTFASSRVLITRMPSLVWRWTGGSSRTIRASP